MTEELIEEGAEHPDWLVEVEDNPFPHSNDAANQVLEGICCVCIHPLRISLRHSDTRFDF